MSAAITETADPRPPCGEHRAYLRHVRRKEPVDDACRDEHNRYMREYRRVRALLRDGGGPS